ncbi:MAG: helix-turn-helix transcriptional regulator [Bacteroidales bacterium]|nr:helix-turn-helix transcriptional regulator [Bacteroidales bacterium]
MDRKLNRIKTVLVNNGRTNKCLSDHLDKDPAAINKWCTNTYQPSLEMTMTIAKLLNVDINELVCLEDTP